MKQIDKKRKNDKIIQELLSDPIYDVRPDGTIWTRKAKTGRIFVDPGRWREMISINKDGYAVIKYNGQQLRRCRIIWAKYGDSALDAELTINHISGKKEDDRPENLEQVTQADNNLHMYRTLKRTATKGNAKITQEIAEKIRMDRDLGYTYRGLVEKYGVSKSTISYVVNKKTWND